MKRFVIATASALFLLAGSAAAAVPNGPATRVTRDNSFSSSAIGGPGVGTVAPDGLTPLVPGIDPAVPDPGLALPGLPGSVSQLLGTVDPALANLVEAVPAPAAGSLSPIIEAPSAVEPPAPVPGLTPPSKPAKPKAQASAPARKQAKGVTRKADLKVAATATDIFKGLPASGHAAYGTGSVIHTHLLQVGNQRLENTDVAFSGATFSSAPISEIKNEVARIVAPALAAGNAFGRGSGLEVGLAIGQSDPNQIIPGSVAEAKAPPSTGLVTKQVPEVNVPPLVSASLLRGQAQAKANAACTTGTDLSYGLGYAADLGLISAGGGPLVASAAESPDRAASQSRAHTFLVPQDGAPSPIRKFGLASETRMTIAPVTLFKGQAQEFTLEFAGEWVLRTVADGKKATVHYGPGDVSPSTPLLRILRPNQAVQDILSTQGLFGPNGLSIDVSPLIKIVIGAPPRMIGGADNSKPIETPTLAAAAVDVVKVQVLAQEGLTGADIRIGHMENATAVPEGGIECGIAMLKKTDKDVVGPGDTFTWTVTVTNPNDCVLTKLKVVDTITATPGVIWTVDSSTPKADQMANSGLTWNDIGPLNPGQSKDLKIQVTVSPKSGGGKFLDEAVATGICGPAAGTAGADAAVGVPLEARVSLNLPEVNAALGALLPRELPRTGGVFILLPALALTGGGLVLRASKRRR
jgi:uncharacterized repeat protein (TIGR01451 family)